MAAEMIFNCIIVVDKNNREGKGYPKFDQTFEADFNELPCGTGASLEEERRMILWEAVTRRCIP